MQSRKPLLGVVGQALSPLQPLLPKEPANGVIWYAMLSVATSKPRYAADRAFRQYDAADPANRLLASELEARWNRALAHAAEVEGKIARHGASTPKPVADPASLGVLTSNLKTGLGCADDGCSPQEAHCAHPRP